MNVMFVVGIVLGTTLGFILCGMLTIGQISDLQAELQYLRMLNDRLRREVGLQPDQDDEATAS